MNKRDMFKAKIEGLSSILILSMIEDALMLSWDLKNVGIKQVKEDMLKHYQTELLLLPSSPPTKQKTLEQAIHEQKGTKEESKT